MISLHINDKKIESDENLTILEAARTAGIDIPTVCYHEKLTPPGLCRQCVVEVEGERNLQPSCITKIRNGMRVQTESERVIRARRTILEMLASSTDLSSAPELLLQMKKYNARPERFYDSEKREYPLQDDNPFYIRDYSRCILCEKCVQVCSQDIQFSFALTTAGRGYDNRITTFYDKTLPRSSCVFCGNCVACCPTGALTSRTEYTLEGGSDDQI